MKNLSVRLYQKSDYTVWNAFIGQAKNATFLFHRDFIEYHKDRFEDYSLMIFDDQKLMAVLPANRVGDIVYSHQGLTYGGLIYNEKVGGETVEFIFDSVLNFLKEESIEELIFKLVPSAYQYRASEELEYFLFQKKATLFKRSMNLTIDYSKPLLISKSKLKHFKRISELDISIEESEDCTSFWNQILIPKLKEKYNSSPVHSLEEINQLKLHFPKNIKQFNAYFKGEIVAGITLFFSQQVVKSQYGANSLKGQSVRALDYLFIHLIQKYSTDFSFFDMGIVDNESSYNKGLLKQKEELGCSIYAQDVYKITIQ
ncbi:FemAB family protein [Flavobacterium maritimum]|uniref:FemAB family protein n=1 Tax=Flavobacterium maritimum TaxID=3149042 RepID=UPI0032B39CBD